MMVQWKASMERRGLKVNIGRTKMMVSGGSEFEVDPVQLGRHPCAVRGRGVGVNFMLCTICCKCCHKRCSRLRTLNFLDGQIDMDTLKSCQSI